MDSNTTDWYSLPLSGEDLIAGLSLFLIGTVGIFFYLLFAHVLWKNSEESTGFRYLFSESIVGSLALFEYGTWPGLTILMKSEITPSQMRHVVQAYIDWVWFIMCCHYSVIAWSRLSAIRFPMFFRSQTKSQSYLICSLCYIVPLIQTIINQQLPFYVLFYYDPSSYGLAAADFVKYKTEGHATYLNIYNALALICPFLLYALALFYFIKQKQGAHVISGSSTIGQQSSSKVEINLMLPCILNTFVFLIGQVMLTIGWDAGKWFGWTVLVLFCVQALANPILLLVFSSAIRQKMAKFLGISKPLQHKESTASNLGTNNRPVGNGEVGERKQSILVAHKNSVMSRANISIIPIG